MANAWCKSEQIVEDIKLAFFSKIFSVEKISYSMYDCDDP